MKPLWIRLWFFSLLAIFAAAVFPCPVREAYASQSVSSVSFAVKTKAPCARKLVVGNKDTKRYHLPGMPYYGKVRKYHRIYFESEQQAIAGGYYRAGTRRSSAFRRGPIAKERILLAAAVSVVATDGSSGALPAKERVWEAPTPDVPKTAATPPLPTGKKSAERAVTKEAVVDVQAAPLSPVARVTSPAVSKTDDVPVKIEADNLSYDSDRDVYLAEGNVVITYKEGILTAASVEYDRKNNQATAEGGAFLKMAQDTLSGEKIVVNVEDKTGVAYNSKVFYARNHFYVKGDKIEKTGENSYRIEKPLATTCDGDHPDWQLAGSEMKVTVEGYGWLTNARLLTKGVPVIYSPVIAFPAKTKRHTGFLFPYLAYSKGKDGIDIEVPFFWAISPQMDATLYTRYLEKRGLKEGLEFRYFAGSKSFGTLYGDYLEDNKHVTETISNTISRDWQETHKRWSFMFNHQTNFDPQFYIRADVKRVSDAWYFRDFNGHNYYLTNYAGTEEDPFKKVPFQGNEALRSLESSARVFKGWDNFNVMARVSSTDDFAIRNNDRTLQKYPEVIFTGIKQPLFSTPLYVEFAGNYDYLYRGEGTRGHYVDIAPTLSLPLSISNYVKITPQLTVREIYWNREDREVDTANRSGDRTVVNAALNMSSRLSRVFNVNILNWEKVRHEIKPEILYSYMPNIRPENIPDYLPRISSLIDPFTTFNTSGTNALTEQNAVAWSLTNTLTARLKNKTGTGGYLEFFRFKLFQVYDINEAKKDMAGVTAERRPMSDLGMELDLKPHPYLNFAARNKYNPYTGWKEMNYDLGISDWRGDRLTFGYRYTLDSIEEINMDLKAAITANLSGKLIVRLDRMNNQTVENTVGLTYTHQCWGVGVDYTKTHDDERVMLRMSLAGLGMFGI